MVVLFLYMIVALLHTAWTVSRGKSSACWDSLTEIVVLAQNSKPSENLKNTCAGMKYTTTFAKKVRVRPTKMGMSSKQTDHLELKVEEEEEMIGDSEMDCIAPGNSSAELGMTSRDRNPSDVSQLSHPSTWPSFRPQHSASTQTLTTNTIPAIPLSQPHSHY